MVQSNQRVLFNNILLIRESPLPLATEDIGYYDSRFLERRGENIEIRSGNEIWAKGSFITRTSVDIGSLQWFPDGKHLVVQIGDEIRLLDLDGKHSQLIIKLNTVQPVAYFFQDSGREFYYIDSGQVKGLELFEPRSLVERISYTQ